jgi:hypothetical protein
MAEKSRLKVTAKVDQESSGDMEELYPRVFLGGGRFAIPSALRMTAELSDDVDVELGVRIEGDPARAHTRELIVRSSQVGGVSSTTLRKIPVRDIVGTGCLLHLHRARTDPDGRISLMRIGGEQDLDVVDEIRRIVQELVGYVEAPEVPS